MACQEWQAVYYPFVCSNLGYWICKLVNQYTGQFTVRFPRFSGCIMIYQDGTS